VLPRKFGSGVFLKSIQQVSARFADIGEAAGQRARWRRRFCALWISFAPDLADVEAIK
jgi:hypothetical protein